jgi:hypothetical protein
MDFSMPLYLFLVVTHAVAFIGGMSFLAWGQVSKADFKHKTKTQIRELEFQIEMLKLKEPS